ncbi:MAG: hypothetical protein GY757_01665 [bacterium]|nr:hypothetical protein [bacterium]
MAIWQYDVVLIPIQSLKEHFKNVPNKLDLNSYDNIEWWKDTPLSKDLEFRISKILPANTSWSPEIKIWGNEDSHCIKLVTDGSYVEEILIRIDLRNLSVKFLEKIIEFTSSADCLLYTHGLLLMEANINLLIEDIKQSDSAKFLLDPVGFLKNLKR